MSIKVASFLVFALAVAECGGKQFYQQQSPTPQQVWQSASTDQSRLVQARLNANLKSSFDKTMFVQSLTQTVQSLVGSVVSVVPDNVNAFYVFDLLSVNTRIMLLNTKNVKAAGYDVQKQVLSQQYPLWSQLPAAVQQVLEQTLVDILAQKFTMSYAGWQTSDVTSNNVLALFNLDCAYSSVLGDIQNALKPLRFGMIVNKSTLQTKLIMANTDPTSVDSVMNVPFFDQLIVKSGGGRGGKASNSDERFDKYFKF